MSREGSPRVAALRNLLGHPPLAGDEPSLSRGMIRALPLVAILVGACGAGGFWLAAQLWPTSVAIALSLLATTLLDARGRQIDTRCWVFVLLIKYNALMALSAAGMPFPVPPYVTLGVIMVAGHGAGAALLVSLLATERTPAGTVRVATVDLCIVLMVGFAVAALLGLPGLLGLAAAILVRLALGGLIFPLLAASLPQRLGMTQSFTEISFYLGALATWKYS